MRNNRTPHNGLRVFRVYRDDAYLALLLRVLSTLASSHVAAGVPPVGSAFLESPGQAAALKLTNEIARRAVVIAEPGCGGGGAASSSGSGGEGAGGSGDGGEGGGGSEEEEGEEEAGEQEFEATSGVIVPPACAQGTNVSAFWT